MKLQSTVLMSTLLVSQVAFAAAGQARATYSDQSQLQLQDNTATPSGELKPGSYSIRIVDHLADRFLVEIRGSGGNAEEKFLAVPAKDFPASAPAGPILENGAKGHSALRGFSFSKGLVTEFVYPKKAAVALAKSNHVTMLAVDPASEGMPSAPDMSPEDMKIVTLWMLTPTPVGPDDGSAQIQAVKYTAPPSMTTERAAVKPPVISRLPKTGSLMPLLSLIGICAAGFALLLRFWRLRTTASRANV